MLASISSDAMPSGLHHPPTCSARSPIYPIPLDRCFSIGPLYIGFVDVHPNRARIFYVTQPDISFSTHQGVDQVRITEALNRSKNLTDGWVDG